MANEKDGKIRKDTEAVADDLINVLMNNNAAGKATEDNKGDKVIDKFGELPMLTPPPALGKEARDNDQSHLRPQQDKQEVAEVNQAREDLPKIASENVDDQVIKQNRKDFDAAFAKFEKAVTKIGSLYESTKSTNSKNKQKATSKEFSENVKIIENFLHGSTSKGSLDKNFEYLSVTQLQDVKNKIDYLSTMKSSHSEDKSVPEYMRQSMTKLKECGDIVRQEMKKPIELAIESEKEFEKELKTIEENRANSSDKLIDRALKTITFGLRKTPSDKLYDEQYLKLKQENVSKKLVQKREIFDEAGFAKKSELTKAFTKAAHIPEVQNHEKQSKGKSKQVVEVDLRAAKENPVLGKHTERAQQRDNPNQQLER